MKFGYTESFLAQIILYSLVWLMSEYMGSLLSLIVPLIAFAILVISIITEKIEKSNVPKSYYAHMLIIILVPIIVGLSFSLIYEGQLDWIETD